MFSNGNFFILFIILKYTSFIKFLLAENSTNNDINNYETYTKSNIYNITTTFNNNLLYMAKFTEDKDHQVTRHRTQFESDTKTTKNIQNQDKIYGKGITDGNFENVTEELLPEPAALFATKQQLYPSHSQSKIHQRLQQPSASTQNSPLPIFPERPDAVYFIVAVIGGAKLWGRTLARTLLDMGPPFGSPLGPPLRPLYVDLPSNGRFSVKVLTSLCQQVENVPLAGVVVIGDGQSARAVALSGNAMKVPVLWARGGTANIHSARREAQTELQSMLQPSAKEILTAIRSLFLQTHWHSFFVISDPDATMVLTGAEGSSLREPPLYPKILPLKAGDGDIFRQLAEISRSTRGIVLLLCNLISARKIMSEAKRLNMAGGHFIWLWADTSSTTEFFDLHQSPLDVRIVEYPEAVKQFTAQTTAKMNGDSSERHLEDLVEKKIDFDEMEKYRHKHDSGWPLPSSSSLSEASNKSRVKQIQKQQPLSHQRQDQQQQQTHPLEKSVEEQGNAGRYVFGLNQNGEDNSEEIVSNKEKRNQNPFEISTDDGTSHSESGEDFDFLQFKQNGANSRHLDSDEVLTSDEASLSYDHFDYADRNIVNDNNSNYNDTETNKSIKPKRTSIFYGKNMTTSHVFFHHFEDFPVGLLALRPVKMPVNRNFIRSTIRLFASTWSHTTQERPIHQRTSSSSSSDDRYRRMRDRNPYTSSENTQNWMNSNYNPKNRSIRKQKSFSSSSRVNRDLNISSETVNSQQQSQQQNNHIRNNKKIVQNVSNIDSSGSTNSPSSVSSPSSSNDSDGSSNISSRSDLNENLTISSHNQNLSGLINNSSNNKSNITDRKDTTATTNLNLNKSLKIKRYKTWWSSKDAMNKNKNNREQQHQQQQQGGSSTQSGGDRHRKSIPYYKGGCFGAASNAEVQKAEIFGKALKEATTLALSGQKLFDGNVEKPLITNFELLNLVPDDSTKNIKIDLKDSVIRRRGPRKPENELTKWRRVGLISGVNVQLDTIVWPGGDIVVSGLSARARTVFRIVTALSPPFVMESELDEDGLCLRGLPCHRLSPIGQHNLTLMFNAIETRDRLKEDATEHGVKAPHDNTDTYDHSLYETKCCYGLSMDLLDNIATELGFEFHLYMARDELFGTKHSNLNDEFMQKSSGKMFNRRKYSDYMNERYEQQGQNHHYSNHYQKNHNSNPYNMDRINRRNEMDGGNIKDSKNRKEHFENHGNPKEEQIYHSASFERLRTNSRPGGDPNDSTEFTTNNEENDENDDGDENDDNNENEQDFLDEMIFYRWSDRRPEAKLPKDTDNRNFMRNKKFSNRKHSKTKGQWNGIIGDLISGSADMSFAPLSVSKSRSQVIDFSVPYFQSGVTLLAAPQSRSEIPLLAFLLPFSPELWIAIFTSLNVTAIAVAIYEWLSPFGLNPWGRQRSKNFSMSSALWVMWGLLCGHLVAFKAPKSWPNKFLINVWGGFSVIFIASYTANIAALIAGLFFHNASNRPEVSLLTSRVGAPIASAAETYVKKKDPHIWEHMKKYAIRNIEEGIRGLKNGSLDLIMGDTPILDYYRATDHGCTLQRIGEPYVHDTYAIGMTKGFPLKESISALIAKYSSNGYLDILTEKWYGGLPCFKDTEFLQPRPLGVEAVAGVFLLLGLGIILGVLILILEYLFYKYTLPILRHKPKGTVWRSRNIMFFSQKLYRFINCVELVSPHHAARELVHTLRQGQIASLFQKSIKRKEDEQRRRRKSKAQFFEMIQEIRRVQQQERANPKLEVVTEDESATDDITATDTQPKPKSSPKPRLFGNRKESRSRSNSSTLNVRRFSTDSILSERLDTIGRRLSRDLTNSPPDFGRRFETFGKNHENKFDTFSGAKALSADRIEETKFDTYSGRDFEKPPIPVKKHLNKRVALNAETFTSRGDCDNREIERSRDDLRNRPIPIIKESLVHPICQEDSSKAELRDRMHEELRNKYSDDRSVLVRSVSNQTNPEDQYLSPQMKQQHHQHHQRQRSLDSSGIEGRPPMPIPILRVSRNDSDAQEPPALPPKVSPRTNLKQISLDRLSREDLLKLSESSQSEIHDYLNKSATDRNIEPP